MLLTQGRPIMCRKPFRTLRQLPISDFMMLTRLSYVKPVNTLLLPSLPIKESFSQSTHYHRFQSAETAHSKLFQSADTSSNWQRNLSTCSRRASKKEVKMYKKSHHHRKKRPTVRVSLERAYMNMEDKSGHHLLPAVLEYIEGLVKASCHEKNEIQRRESILKNKLQANQLELRGLAITGLKVDEGYFKPCAGGRFELKLLRDESHAAASGVWRQGSLVTLEYSDSGDFENLDEWQKHDGIISEITSCHVRVQVGELRNNFLLKVLMSPSSTPDSAAIRIVKRSEAHIYNNYIQSLKRILMKRLDLSPNKPLGMISKALFATDNGPPVCESQGNLSSEQQLFLFNKQLEEDGCKLKALNACSQCLPVTLLHGPPGTGKTTTLAAAVLSAIANGDKVLLVGPSHAACDALTLALASQWPVSGGRPRCVRLADRLRITSAKVEPFLAERFVKHHRPDLIQELRRVEMELTSCRQEVMDRADGRGRGQILQQEAHILREYNGLKQETNREAVEASPALICTIMTATLSSHIQYLLQSKKFDLLVIDEAGFTPTSNVLPLIVAAGEGDCRIILAGDHLQLPPIVHTQEAEHYGLDTSLFEQLVNKMEENVYLLETQYRSNFKISEWSSSYFYDDRLKADASVANILAADIVRSEFKNRSLLKEPFLFIDTVHMNWLEHLEDEESVSNWEEAVFMCDLVERFLAVGVNPHHIGVIAPYWAQIALIRELLWEGAGHSDIEIRTVDGFQGREKEIILLSLVRSNTVDEVGFLSDTRRINVSVTRARRSCIIVGNSRTLSSDSGLESLVEHCAAKKQRITVEQFYKSFS